MEFDFTGVTPRNPLVSFAPEPGAYKCRIVRVDPQYNGGKSTQFELETLAGPAVGISIAKYVGNEAGEKGGNKANWLGALMAIAPDPDAFRVKAQAGMKFDPMLQAVQTFTGKEIHAFVVEEPGTDSQGRPNLPRIEFITRAQYATIISGGKGSEKVTKNGPGPEIVTPAKQGADVLKDLFT